jgi:hypothetical protein
MTAETIIIWLGVGLSTGKFSEQMSGWYFSSKANCEQAISKFEDGFCLPVATTPDGAKAILKALKETDQ